MDLIKEFNKKRKRLEAENEHRIWLESMYSKMTKEESEIAKRNIEIQREKLKNYNSKEMSNYIESELKKIKKNRA